MSSWVIAKKFIHEAQCRSLMNANGRVTSSDSNLLSAKLALNFLAILFHSTSAADLVHRQTVLPFLATLVDVLLREHADSPTSRILNPSLLITASIMRKSCPDFAAGTDNYWSPESVWKLALRSGRSNLLIACEFHPTWSPLASDVRSFLFSLHPFHGYRVQFTVWRRSLGLSARRALAYLFSALRRWGWAYGSGGMPKYMSRAYTSS